MADPTPISVEQVRAAIESFDWAAWRKKLRERYERWHKGIVQDDAQRVAEDLGADWKKDDPYLAHFADRYVAERVTQIDESTRDHVQATVVRAFRDAEERDVPISIQAIAEVLRDKFADFSAARANTIARTETAIAENHGAAFGYIAAGFAFVQISDGDGDDACAAADGEIWSVEYWMANPIEHPNCERSGSPISTDEALELGVDRE